MSTFKVKAAKLNVRTAPVEDFTDKGNVIGKLMNDAPFESVNEKTNKLGQWFQDVNGHWAWGGALEHLAKTQESVEIEYENFVTALNLDWLKTRGQGVSIGLIDTGITPNNDFYNSFSQEVISNSNTTLHHGNFIGGIICGKKNIGGIAQNATLFSIKYKSDGEDISVQLNNFITALTKFLNISSSIILNISQGFNSQTVTEKFQAQEQQIINLIKQISAQKNKLIICAADDNSAINDVAFPANMDECISVGCIDEFSTDLIIKVKLDILTPMVTYTSFDNSFNKIKDAGSSFSTAMISAFAACYLAKNNSITRDAFLKDLEKSSTHRSLFNYGNIKSFQYQII